LFSVWFSISSLGLPIRFNRGHVFIWLAIWRNSFRNASHLRSNHCSTSELFLWLSSLNIWLAIWFNWSDLCPNYCSPCELFLWFPSNNFWITSYFHGCSYVLNWLSNFAIWFSSYLCTNHSSS
jgi:hypothetical protein